MAILKQIILWFWQLPQHLLGLALYLIYLPVPNKGVFITEEISAGISLGEIVILPKFDETDAKHEHGHTIQSRILGPLYLFVIGIPSLCGNLIDRFFHKGWPAKKRNKWYFSLPWEKWADKLGGVIRKEK